MATDKLVEIDHVNYISQEAEIRFFNDWVDDLDKQINDSANYPHLRSDYKVCKTQLLDCIHAIKEMPAADVRPVVRGKWEPAGGSVFPMYACSLCRAISLGGNFCPNCGADMRETQTLKNASQNTDADIMMPAT